MDDIECPACGDAVDIGLPRGATVLSVANEPPDENEPATKTRCVRCGADHAIYFTFGGSYLDGASFSGR